MLAKALDVLREFERWPIGETPIPQADLDLTIRPDRTSALPWRGQFNPELVANLLSTYAERESVICDPFVGSGTSIIEAARQGCLALCSEVTPAAFELASLLALVTLDGVERNNVWMEAAGMIGEFGLDADDDSLWGSAGPVSDFVYKMIEHASNPHTRSIVAVAVLLAMSKDCTLGRAGFRNAMRSVGEVVQQLPDKVVASEVHLADARALPIGDAVVDLVITSPPYINVFNYHHHYRAAVELLGWEVLEPSRSEIGANRKHRQNRFLTVIQYCIDMAQAISEMSRVTKPGRPIVLVVGRESNVLGTPFFNGRLVAAVAASVCGLELDHWQERKFQNRFGQRIFEDVLTLRAANDAVGSVVDRARAIGMAALEQARPRAPSPAMESLNKAVALAEKIQPSPLLATGLTCARRSK